MFRKSSLFSGLLLALSVVGAQYWLRSNRPQIDLRPADTVVEWTGLSLGPMDDPRARLAGAWELKTGDGRIGGLSGLALDRGRLLVLTDGGMLAWLPMPPEAGTATVRPLPAVAGNPRTKIGRDSEALARDPGGRGWWVAFEQRHQLILYDRDFRRALRRIDMDVQGLRRNRGIEALAGADDLHWYAERGGVSDATTLPDGRQLLLERGFGLGGLTAHVSGLGGEPVRLPTGPLDNAEGLAAQLLPDGMVRLWVVTDNDFRRWRPSRLLAVDVPQAAAD